MYLDGSSLNTTDGNRANTTDLVHILERQAEGLVGRAGRRVDGVNGFEKGLSSALGLGLLFPALVPWAIGGNINHVIAVEARDGHKGNVLGIIPDFLDKIGSFLDDLIVTVFGPFGGVHLVDCDDKLPDTQGIGKESVFAGLAIL